MAERKRKPSEAEKLREGMRTSGWLIILGAAAFAFGWLFDSDVGQHDPIARLADVLFTYGGPLAVLAGLAFLFSKD